MLHNSFRRKSALALLLLSAIILVGASGPSSSWPGATGLSAGGWRGWTSIGTPGGGATQLPVVGINSDGRYEVFAQAGPGTPAIYHIWQTSLNGGWSSWDLLNASSNQFGPYFILNYDARMMVFAASLTIISGGPCAGAHYEIASISQSAPSNGWDSWQSLGNPVSGSCIDLELPTVGYNVGFRKEVFARGMDGNIWHKWETAMGSGFNSNWASLSHPGSMAASQSLAVASQADGRLTVFGVGDDYEIYQIWQETVGDSTSWHNGWVSFGKPPGVNLRTPAVSFQDGRLIFFAAGSDGAIWSKSQVAPNSYWSGWTSLKPSGVNLDTDGVPVIWWHPSGALELFARGQDGRLWYIQQNAPSFDWGSWDSMDGPPYATLTNRIAAPEWHPGGTDNIILFAVGTDGSVWTNQQSGSLHLPLLIR